jgi:cell division protein FtsW
MNEHKRQLQRTVMAAMTYDFKLLFPVLLLAGIGIVMVYSSSSALALKKFGSDYYFLKKQAIYALAGVMALVAARHFPYRYLKLMAYPLMVLSLGLLVATLFSGFGLKAGGATRWLRLAGLTFQPSELARFALVIYLAYSMNRKADKLRDFFVGFLPHVMVLCVFTALIFLQPDFGSVAIMFAVTWIMLFVGGVRFSHLVSVFILAMPAGYYFLTTEQYRVKRLLSFVNPWEYPSTEGYQIIHSLMAFGTGGLWGTGVGKGYQKLFYLPEPHTDFVFSVIGEELGLIGVLAILFLYGMILWRGLAIASRAKDAFASFVAMGLTVAISLQVVINMGVALALLPTKGLTLPFLSYGGSSLLVNMAAVGVLMNISATGQRSTA